MARAGRRQPASMGLYSAKARYGPDECSYTLLPRVQTAEDECIDVLERHTQESSFVARAGGRQHASMGLYSAIGPDEYSYASTRYSVVRIGVGEQRKRGAREGLGNSSNGCTILYRVLSIARMRAYS